MSNDEIENTINKKTKVTTLEGEHKLQVEENANNVIDSLSNLNTPQKIAEKHLLIKLQPEITLLSKCILQKNLMMQWVN